MTHFIDPRFNITHTLEGPLAPWLSGFADSLSPRGYSPATITHYTLHAIRFSGWLERQDIEFPSCVQAIWPGIYSQNDCMAGRM